MAIRKILGIETEYGILIRGAADSNPIAASSVLINAYVNDLNRSLLIRVAGYWVGTLVLLYFIGLLLAWVRRGFRT